MEIDKTDLTFIDNYLKNSGIEFTDIRMEMTDHVAMAVGDEMTKGISFYEAFKAFMVQHKKELLKANKAFVRAADKKVLRMLCRQALKPLPISVALFGFVLGYLLINLAWVPALKLLPLGVLFLVLGYYYFTVRRAKERFSGLERMGLLLVILVQINQVFLNPFTKNGLENYDGLAFASVLAMSCWVSASLVAAMGVAKKQYQPYKILRQ